MKYNIKTNIRYLMVGYWLDFKWIDIAEAILTLILSMLLVIFFIPRVIMDIIICLVLGGFLKTSEDYKQEENDESR